MLVTKSAVFLQVPKTAGTWLAHVLEPILIDKLEEFAIPTEIKHLPVYGWVRNPWEWYASFYDYQRSGSDEYDRKSKSVYKAFGKKEVAFDEFLKQLLAPTTDYINRIINWEKIEVMQDPQLAENGNRFKIYSGLEIFILWKDNPIPLLKHMHQTWLTPATRIYKVDNIRTDLIEILKDLNLLTEELESRILKEPARNESVLHNYTDYYTEETRQLVYNEHRDFIEKYNYKFGME
jgi:hypothetical protein